MCETREKSVLPGRQWSTASECVLATAFGDVKVVRNLGKSSFSGGVINENQTGYSWEENWR